MTEQQFIEVSVPCRGTTFLNAFLLYFPTGIFFNVSVPCRGTTFLNVLLESDSITVVSFRPLSANYISQYDVKALYEQLDSVSVPCRGTTFLN